MPSFLLMWLYYYEADHPFWLKQVRAFLIPGRNCCIARAVSSAGEQESLPVVCQAFSLIPGLASGLVAKV